MTSRTAREAAGPPPAPASTPRTKTKTTETGRPPRTSAAWCHPDAHGVLTRVRALRPACHDPTVKWPVLRDLSAALDRYGAPALVRTADRTLGHEPLDPLQCV